MGLVARQHKNRLEAQQPAAQEAAGTTFAIGTAIWLLIGVPSVAVGVLELGIPSEHADWRWLPIAIGSVALVIGLLGGLLYGAGSLALAADPGAKADKPATLWIRKVAETGTFVNERPRLQFDFFVEPDASTGLTSYEVTKKATVPFTAMGSLRVGGGFRATVVGPEKPEAMDIDWASPVPSPTPGSDVAPEDHGPDDVSDRLDALDRLREDARITDREYQAQRQRILDSL